MLSFLSHGCQPPALNWACRLSRMVTAWSKGSLSSRGVRRY
jgi:hypothetical protein